MRRYGAWASVIVQVLAACATGASPTPKSVPTAEVTGTVSSATPTTGATPSRETRLAVHLDSVPRVDLDIHGVPLEEVVFDTFDGGFVRLSEASERIMDSLRDAIVPLYQPGYGSAADLSDLVMFAWDHQTGSYWFQVLGESIVGTMTGKRLNPLPAMTTRSLSV